MDDALAELTTPDPTRVSMELRKFVIDSFFHTPNPAVDAFNAAYNVGANVDANAGAGTVGGSGAISAAGSLLGYGSRKDGSFDLNFYGDSKTDEDFDFKDDLDFGVGKASGASTGYGFSDDDDNWGTEEEKEEEEEEEEEEDGPGYGFDDDQALPGSMRRSVESDPEEIAKALAEAAALATAPPPWKPSMSVVSKVLDGVENASSTTGTNTRYVWVAGHEAF